MVHGGETETLAADADSAEKAEELGQNFPLSGAPREVRQTMSAMFAMMGGAGSMPNPIMKQITSEHIDKLLDNSKTENQLDHERFKLVFWGRTFLVIAFLAFLVFAIVFLKDDPDLLKMLISGIIGLIAGALGGYGLAKAS